MLWVLFILCLINLTMFLDNRLDPRIMQANIIDKVLHNTEHISVQTSKRYIGWHTCWWRDWIASCWRSIMIWSVYFLLLWIRSCSSIFSLTFFWCRRRFTLEWLLVESLSLRLYVKKIYLSAWSTWQWCMDLRSLGEFAQVDGFLRPIAHIGVHLGKNNINHLSQTCFGCVFVNLAGWGDVDGVLCFECFQKSSLVHFTVNCYHYS